MTQQFLLHSRWWWWWCRSWFPVIRWISIQFNSLFPQLATLPVTHSLTTPTFECKIIEKSLKKWIPIKMIKSIVDEKFNFHGSRRGQVVVKNISFKKN
jgi:hypothetical protein